MNQEENEMIVVKVELHSAVTKKITLLGQAIIDNIGTTPDGKKGDYRVRVGSKNKLELDQVATEYLREGKIKDFPRLSYNIWRLVIRALKSAFPEEK